MSSGTSEVVGKSSMLLPSAEKIQIIDSYKYNMFETEYVKTSTDIQHNMFYHWVMRKWGQILLLHYFKKYSFLICWPLKSIVYSLLTSKVVFIYVYFHSWKWSLCLEMIYWLILFLWNKHEDLFLYVHYAMSNLIVDF